VGSVAVAIGVLAITGVVGKEGSTSTKVRVRGVDTGVNDVGTSTRSRGGVINVGGRPLVNVRDAAKAPGSTALGGKGLLFKRFILFPERDLDDSVSLDIVNLER
jgi:hypothetical protein